MYLLLIQLCLRKTSLPPPFWIFSSCWIALTSRSVDGLENKGLRNETKKKCTRSKKHNLRSWETIKNEDDENWKRNTTKQRNKMENKYAEVECMAIQDPWLIFFLSRNDVFPTSCVSFPKSTFASRFNSLLPWVKLLEIWKG